MLKKKIIITYNSFVLLNVLHFINVDMLAHMNILLNLRQLDILLFYYYYF